MDGKVQDVKIIPFEGRKPEEDTIKTIIQNRQQKGLQLKTLETTPVYLAQNGIEKYVVTMIFTRPPEKGLYQDMHGRTTAELDMDIETELDGQLDDENLGF